MAVDSLQLLVADAQEVALGLQAARAEISSALGDGSYTTASLRHLLATVAGLRADIRTLRRSLDQVDAADFLRGSNAQHIIGLWQWQRGLRGEFIALDAASLEVEVQVALLLSGTGHRIHVVRSGETLQSIAADELGDWKEWRTLAEVNDLAPGAVSSGTILVVPSRS